LAREKRLMKNNRRGEKGKKVEIGYQTTQLSVTAVARGRIREFKERSSGRAL